MVSFPPFWPTLVPGLLGRAEALHTAVARAGSRKSVAPTTVTLTVALVLPKASTAVIWKESDTGAPPKGTAGEMKYGVSVSPLKIVTVGPLDCVQATVAVGQAFGRSLPLAASMTCALPPPTISGPALPPG